MRLGLLLLMAVECLADLLGMDLDGWLNQAVNVADAIATYACRKV